MFKEAKVVLMVADVERSVKFYTEALGLKLKVSYGSEWAEVEVPGLIIALHPARGTEPRGEERGHMSIGFQVPDLDKAMASLKRRGVKFGPVRSGFVRQTDFADPDGTPLYLAEVR